MARNRMGGPSDAEIANTERRRDTRRILRGQVGVREEDIYLPPKKKKKKRDYSILRRILSGLRQVRELGETNKDK